MSGYGKLHERLRRVRGPASNYRCGNPQANPHCQGQAREWAYDGSDPLEQYAEHMPGKRPLAYSLSLSRYTPLCRSCHNRFDGVGARNGPAAGGWQLTKTHCPRGHAYDEANTGWRTFPDGRRHRRCRACNRERMRRYKKGLSA